MKFDQYHPYYYPVLVGGGVLAILIYWLIWRKNAKLANGIVGAALVGVICCLIDCDYALREYFIIKSWKLP